MPMTVDRSDSAAMMAGYTRPVFIDIGFSSFAALIQPDEDTDGQFAAFDTDNQEWLTVNGWLIDTLEELEG